MAYIDATINHLRAVHEWSREYNMEVRLDLLSFELEVKGRNRYFVLYPQFVSVLNGQRAHTATLTRSGIGFIGWLPYRPVQWPLSSDKLRFKSRARELGLRTPAMWAAASQADGDYLLKASAGSFGNDLAGPYVAGNDAEASATAWALLAKRSPAATIFAEQFICGRNLKAWFWGGQVFHLELDAYPEIGGDGHQTIAALLEQKLMSIASSLEQYRELPMVEQSLGYQGLTLASILEPGQRAWLDFRYGRRFVQENNQLDSNQLSHVQPLLKNQIVEAGAVLAKELQTQWNAPVLYSLDGVVDLQGQIWWLEMNSNPIFAPAGYRPMLATLFGTPFETVKSGTGERKDVDTEMAGALATKAAVPARVLAEAI